MIKYLLDTDICIYIIKQKPQSVIGQFKKMEIGDVGISAITMAELEYGVAKSQQKEKNKIALAAFLVPLEILPFTANAATVYGELRTTLEKKGLPIGSHDLLIASQALAENIILVTNNLSEFTRIPDLRAESWV